MNILQSIAGQIRLTRLISEEEIRRDHVLQLCLQADSSVAQQRSPLTRLRRQLHRKWRRLNLAVELHAVHAGSPSILPESNLPAAHSSLSLVEAFGKASAIFKGSNYSIYCVAGDTDQIEPLLGRDSIVVFEKMGPPLAGRQPVQRGDIVISKIDGVPSLHRITALNVTQQEFAANQTYRGHLQAIEQRLVAVFYTCRSAPSPDQTGRVSEQLDQSTLFTQSWDEAVFNPEPGNKPTPHSTVTLWGAELGRARRVFPHPACSVWTDVLNTNSMEPLLDSSTAVIFETLTEQVLLKQPLRPGDIVTWEEPTGGGALHRIIGQAEDGARFYIKGDNNRYGDCFEGSPLIPRQFITRRAVAIIYGRQLRQDD